ncbi:deoxyguanosinetriphosphate triphosphohydrolase [Marinilabiliaceae bacterium JC017]|nr:deoxyguanosinetriphosphate triphosphohydrolase [Marinilabiliaceae bacterium JC017]
MNWNQLLSAKRTGQEDMKTLPHHDRTQFQRDFDRLVFSSPFRRLQDKTQVFPLPGSVFVHNRLTHSLEVASVGRSLGNNITRFLKENKLVDSDLVEEIGSVVGAACLAHDMGNPPFGHSGEEAISNYFQYGQGKELEEKVLPAEWKDLIAFEGNANAFRILTHQFAGRRKGGFSLTYTTVASILKYPFESGLNIKKKKYGYFQSEKNTFEALVNDMGLKRLDAEKGIYARHPLVYLVEAADDICYQVMDIEDAHKLKILSYEETCDLLKVFFAGSPNDLKRINEVFGEVSDRNEQIAFLRAKVIGLLVNACTDTFIEQHDAILQGTFKGSLIDSLTGTAQTAMNRCINTAIDRIYKHPSVVEIEIAGFKILGTLLHEFIHAVLEPELYYSRMLLPFIPEQFIVSESATVYEKIQSVLDFISGMTDLYALDLFRKTQGIQLSKQSF